MLNLVRPRRLCRSVGLLLVACVVAAAWAQPPVSSRLAPRPAAGLFKPGALDFEPTSGKVLGLYVANWEPVSRVAALPGGSLTHVLYAFLRACGPGQLPKDGPRCAGRPDHALGWGPVDARFDEAFAALKARAPQLKVLASVGGWGGSDPFFHFANEAPRRAVFVASALQFLREHPSFDGLDIDWEHPGGNGSANGVALGSPADGQGFADLMQDLRAGLDRLTAETGRPYQLTVAVNPIRQITRRIDYRRAAPALDLVFMMSYDYHGGWSERVGHHSALRGSGPDSDDDLASSVQNLVAAGVPRSKLVAGVAMYGRGFSGVSQPAHGAAKSGAFPGSEGSLGWAALSRRYFDGQGRPLHGYEVRFDPVTQSYAIYHPRLQLWIGYDDPRAVIAKGRFVREEGLAGVFAWEWSQDDGVLFNAMNRGLGHPALP
ncbi:glycoside hydrolase family 18 protein [Pelomonas sp. APW6]|uniref:chitinase n=1 Tax=Roseateles subflavus TaxID=3053353 RepID=A0ABT7LP94_9BURK|nr:glycoside hydrolase family 18 protein [Pelomonas sp. APW6]MDL5034589.1 glycoside hydrolase family 18 protein [Pelomonas sp. APW6]